MLNVLKIRSRRIASCRDQGSLAGVLKMDDVTE